MRFSYFLPLFCGLVLCGTWSSTATAQSALPQDNTKAVILAYGSVGEDGDPDTTLPLALFQEHLAEIQRGGLTVLPLPKLLSALKNGDSLPPGSIVLTFDGADTATFKNALPLLLARHLPFTLFYASDDIDQNVAGVMNWHDLESLAQMPEITLGVLPASYTHTADLPNQDMIGQLNKARQRYREHFGREAEFLAYPFGEYSLALKTLAAQQGFKAALGLHSGAAYAGMDLYALPRFTMTETYGDIARFRMVTKALPLPVTALDPADPALGTQDWRAGFTLPETLAGESENLSCFIAGQAPPRIERLNARIELRSAESLLEKSKIRLNCTMPGPVAEDGTPQWRWLGALYHRPAHAAENGINLLPDEPQGLPE